MNRTLFLTIASCAFFWLVACDRINPDSASSRAFVEDNAVASVLSTLTGKNDTSFEGKKYEPVYGEVLDDSNPGERSVQVPSAAFGESYFRSISCGSSLIKKTSDGLVLDLTGKGFGKLTYHKGSGTNVGYVDVEIPCIPSLSKISYKTEEQWGENAGGFSVYNVGDVVKGPDDDYYLVVQGCDRGPGIMVRVQPGRGDDFHYFRPDEDWGPWLPNNDYTVLESEYRYSIKYCLDYQAFDLFVQLCKDPSFAQRKKQIIEATGRNVFPEVAVFTEKSEMTSNGFEGFATTRPGYSHYVGDSQVKAVKVIFNCESDSYSGNPGTYIAMCSRLSADSANEAPSVESLFYNGEKQFKGRFYESGSIAVYTVYVRYFSNNSWYGQEVALGES